MIVEPGFLDHWKTKLLVRHLGTEAAPLCVLRLWEHCQQRRKDRFTGMTPDRLSAICGWTGDASRLWDVMAETFLDVGEGVVVVHDWSDSNAGLMASWANGQKGGRPKRLKPQTTVELDAVEAPVAQPTRETDVEPPARFPRTETDAKAAAAVAGCPEAFAVETWNLAMSRSGRDSRGQPIASWPHYLKVQFQYSANRRAEASNVGAGSHSNRRHSRETSTPADSEF